MDHKNVSTKAMAASATLHCLTGCAIGEVTGMVVGTAAGLSNAAMTALAVGLAFVFGYGLSALPLIRHGMSWRAVAPLIFASDTLSIMTMEITDNAVIWLIPGAVHASLASWLFWVSMAVSLFVAFWAAFPVNLWLLRRGKGHALLHGHH